MREAPRYFQAFIPHLQTYILTFIKRSYLLINIVDFFLPESTSSKLLLLSIKNYRVLIKPWYFQTIRIYKKNSKKRGGGVKLVNGENGKWILHGAEQESSDLTEFSPLPLFWRSICKKILDDWVVYSSRPLSYLQKRWLSRQNIDLIVIDEGDGETATKGANGKISWIVRTSVVGQTIPFTLLNSSLGIVSCVSLESGWMWHKKGRTPPSPFSRYQL